MHSNEKKNSFQQNVQKKSVQIDICPITEIKGNIDVDKSWIKYHSMNE